MPWNGRHDAIQEYKKIRPPDFIIVKVIKL